MAVKYYDPSVIFGDNGTKMDVPKNVPQNVPQETTLIPSKTLVAATPVSTSDKIDTPSSPVQTPEIKVLANLAEPIQTPEAKLPMVQTPQRKYYNPEEIFNGTSETVKTEPKDAYEAAVMARPGGQSQDGATDNLKTAEDKGLFTWTPGTPSSAVGSKMGDVSTRYYAVVLQDQLASMGTDAQTLLKSTYSDAYNEAMAGHGRPVIPYKRTPELMLKYQQDLADWQSRDAYGRAKAEKAVMDRKGKLSDDAAKWADNIAKENQKIIGKDNEMLFDPSKRDVANHILTNEKQIQAVTSKLNSAKTASEIAAQIPSLAYAASIARSPEVQPSQFSIEETKQIVDKLDPDGNADEKNKLIKSAIDYWTLKTMGKAGGMPDPITAYVQKLEYNKPGEIKKRLQEYMVEVKDMNNISRRSYIKHSKDMEITPDVVKPDAVSNKDFEDPANPDKKGLIFNSLIRWNKLTSLTPDEVRLGIKDPNKTATGENEGVAAFQSYLKNKLGAQNYKVTGVPSKDDEAALDILLKQNPSMSAKDIITEGLRHQADIDETKHKGSSTKTKKRPSDTETTKYADNGSILVKNPNGAGYHKTGSWK
jgi:hypothetical protein